MYIVYINDIFAHIDINITKMHKNTDEFLKNETRLLLL